MIAKDLGVGVQRQAGNGREGATGRRRECEKKAKGTRMIFA